MDILLLLITLLASAVLATEISYNSDLAYQIKKFFILDEEKPFLSMLTKWRFYYKLLGTISFVLSPLIICAIMIVSIYRALIKMVNCPYCISFHITWINMMYFMNISFPLVFLYGLIGVATTNFYERYVMNG